MNMKKFTSIMLTIAGITAILGMVCMIIAFAMGLTTDKFVQMAKDGRFALKIKNMKIIEIEENDEYKHQADIELGVISDSSVSVEERGEEKIYSTPDTFKNMNIEFGAGVFDIYYDDVEEIEIHEKNVDGFKVEVKNNTLVIKNNLEVTLGDVDDMDKRSLIIVIPRDMTFDKVDMSIGAAQADIEGITAKTFDIVVGAGQANLSKITSDSMEMKIGAGEANVSNLDVKDLDLEVGMGEANLALCGSQTDYNYDVECGMGDVKVGQHGFGGLGAEHHGDNHHAERYINIECGMGMVSVEFMY